MATIRNINERYGDPVLIEGDTVEDAVAALQAGLRTCGPEFADIVVTEDDYEIVETESATRFIQLREWQQHNGIDTKELVAAWLNCRHVELHDGAEVYVEDPQQGHYLDDDELDRFCNWCEYR